ncbi:10543_t:CDS:2, partial [Cetraspora pellucida]
LFFRRLSKFDDKINIQLNSIWIITDFEKAVINASCCELPNAINKFLMIWHLFALLFLSSNKISAGFKILKANMPPEASDMIQ